MQQRAFAGTARAHDGDETAGRDLDRHRVKGQHGFAGAVIGLTDIARRDDDIAPMEAPDWWDEDDMPPPMPPDEGDSAGDFPPFDEPLPFDNEPGPRATVTGRAEGDRIRLRLGETSLVVSGGSFQEMLTAIKNIPGRRFNSQDKIWELPADLTLDSVEQSIQAAGFDLLPG